MFGFDHFAGAEPWANTKVTVELREIVESGVDVWGFDYPSYYKDTAKIEFERKVIDHFYFRQIGQETVGRWLHCFRTKIREIMPYYIKMYETCEMMDNLDDPFENVNITETFEESRDSEKESNGSVKGSEDSTRTLRDTEETNTNHRFSNTPQGEIANIMTYLTEASIDDGSLTKESSDTLANTSEGTSSDSSKGSETVKSTLTRKGNHGVDTFAKVIKEHRSAFLNVDMMIIEELNDLFLKVY